MTLHQAPEGWKYDGPHSVRRTWLGVVFLDGDGPLRDGNMVHPPQVSKWSLKVLMNELKIGD